MKYETIALHHGYKYDEQRLAALEDGAGALAVRIMSWPKSLPNS